MSALEETLTALERRNLLGRVLKLKVGEIEVLLDGVPTTGPDTPQLTPEQERRLIQETIYGAAQGWVPGAEGLLSS